MKKQNGYKSDYIDKGKPLVFEKEKRYDLIPPRKPLSEVLSQNYFSKKTA
jgi:hypothetical protein